jgi:hypothetical protein
MYYLSPPPYPFRFPPPRRAEALAKADPRFARGLFNAINFTTTRNRYFRVCG